VSDGVICFAEFKVNDDDKLIGGEETDDGAQDSKKISCGDLVVRDMDSRLKLNGCEFNSRPRCCRVTTIGKSFMCSCYQAVGPINWYRCKSRDVNRHTTRCTSPVSVISQYKGQIPLRYPANEPARELVR